jgi:hypothetical protein
VPYDDDLSQPLKGALQTAKAVTSGNTGRESLRIERVN